MTGYLHNPEPAWAWGDDYDSDQLDYAETLERIESAIGRPLREAVDDLVSDMEQQSFLEPPIKLEQHGNHVHFKITQHGRSLIRHALFGNLSEAIGGTE